MFLVNYHTHCDFCDGQGSMRSYAEAAFGKGFKALGFSSHSPAPYENEWTMKAERFGEYLETAAALRKDFSGRMEIYTGLELDYLKEDADAFIPLPEILKLDFRIGSVHAMYEPRSGKYLSVDGPVEEFITLLDELFRGKVEDLAEEYYSRVLEMTEMGGFEILGHLDLIKKRNRDNRFFDENSPWYNRMVRNLVERISPYPIIVEVNTGGIVRGAIDSVYPSPWILYEIRKAGLSVMINTDAHKPEQLGVYHEEAADILKDTGFKTVRALLDDKWQNVPL